MKPHIGILAIDSWAGGVMYTHNLVRALASLPDAERPHLTLFYKYSPGPFKNLLPFVDQHVAYRPWFDRFATSKRMATAARRLRRGMSMILGDDLPELALAARRAGVGTIFPIMHARHRLIPRPIAWIPDFQHRALPEFFSPQEIRLRDRAYQAILQQEGDVVFSSEHACSDAMRYYGMPTARTSVLRFATVPDHEWEVDISSVGTGYNVPADYLIICNQFWAHKDHRTVFQAVQLLVREGIDVHVVCTGATQDYRRPDYFKQIQDLITSQQIESHISILGMIPRQAQIQLIRGASAVVQPSLFEGWSTVLEDARALGKTVIASDFPVHVEQNLPGAIYFRRGDPEDCARAIAEYVRRGWRQHQIPDQGDSHERVLAFARSFMAIVNS